MAHYKRGKCRRNCPRAIRGSSTSWRARHGFKPVRIDLDKYWPGTTEWYELWHQPGKSHLGMMGSYPAWWDRTFHTRPWRAKSRQLEKAILRGADPDNAVWPIWGKPHIYYW